MKKNFTPLFIVIMSSILFMGCFGVDGNFLRIKKEILSSTDAHYYKEQEFGIGSIGLSMARIVVSLSDDDHDAREILKHISKVQVGCYRYEDGSSIKSCLQLMKSIDARMIAEGWEYIVKSRDGGEMNIIYIKTNPGYHLKEIFVVSLEHDRLSLVNVKGDLEKVIQEVIRDKGMSFGKAMAYR